jgi:cobalt/nickel transport system permease protein
LLAYGCNVFNLGFYTCFIAYPLIYKWITRKGVTAKRIFIASMSSAVIGLQMGAFSVVLETLLSGKTELPFGTFLLVMQPIHLAIGIVEGFVTATIVTFVWRARPEIIEKAAIGEALGNISIKKILTGILIAVVVVGGSLSWFASADPDGLEWSMEKTSGTADLRASDGIHKTLSEIQSKTAFLPNYSFKTNEGEKKEKPATQAENAWPSINGGTSVSGIVGGTLTLALVAFIGLIIRIVKRKRRKVNA